MILRPKLKKIPSVSTDSGTKAQGMVILTKIQAQILRLPELISQGRADNNIMSIKNIKEEANGGE